MRIYSPTLSYSELVAGPLSVARPVRTAQDANITLDPIGMRSILSIQGPPDGRSDHVRARGVAGMKTYRDLVAEAKRAVPEVTAEDVHARLARGEALAVVDVRDPDEYRDGAIEPAPSHQPGLPRVRCRRPSPIPTTPIVLYCQTGLRSMLAGKALKELGYENVTQCQGGFQKWAQSGCRWSRTSRSRPTRSSATAATSCCPRWARRASAAAALQGAADRRGRARLADRALPGRGRRRHDRPHGRRRRRHLEPPAPDPAHHAPTSAGRRSSRARETIRALNPDVNVVALPSASPWTT